jgi:hypothetical protein
MGALLRYRLGRLLPAGTVVGTGQFPCPLFGPPTTSFRPLSTLGYGQFSTFKFRVGQKAVLQNRGDPY